MVTGKGLGGWLAIVVVVCGPLALGGEIPWRSGAMEIARSDQGEIAQAISQLASRDDGRHIVVQFERPIGPAQREGDTSLLE